MSRSGADKVVAELTRVVDYFRKEYNLSYAEALGCLHLIIEDIVQKMRDQV
jgi:hypothetical protein